MNRIHTLALALVALSSLATSACTGQPVESDESQDESAGEESVGTAESALAPKYMLGSSGSYPWFIYGEEPADYDMHSCTMLTNGVIRSWQLKEKNAKDFRFSRHWCRSMLGDGTLGSTNDSFDHFYYDGTGTLGMSSVPLDRVPVGVRIQAEYQPVGSVAYKISDVAMLYMSAANVYAQYTGASQAPYALDRNDSTYTIACPAGQVMTGLAVKEKITSGTADASEITGLKLHCQTLLFQ